MHIRQLRGWLMRLFGMFKRARREREFAEELESHLALHIEDNLRAGMSPEEARRVALLKLGGVTLTKERYREQRGLPMLETLFHDVRFGLRMLRKNPAFSLIAVVTLALGIGANTAIFSVVNAALLRPLPYEHADRLVMIWDTNAERALDHERPAPGNFLDWKAQRQVFDGMAAWFQTSRTLRDEHDAEQVQVAQVAGDFFQILQTSVTAGRTFSPAEVPGAVYNSANGYVGGDRVAAISDGLWRRRFGGDAGIVGRTIQLDGQSWQVVAVMRLDFAIPNKEVELWTPWDLTRMQNARDQRFLHVIARLKDGVTLAQAQANLNSLVAASADRYPKANKG